MKRLLLALAFLAAWAPGLAAQTLGPADVRTKADGKILPPTGSTAIITFPAAGGVVIGTSIVSPGADDLTAAGAIFGGGTDQLATFDNSSTPFVQLQSTNAAQLGISRFVNSAFSPTVYLAKSRGTTIGSYTIVSSGDNLGEIQFNGSNGASAFTDGANIFAQVDGTPGSAGDTTDMPGRLSFGTTADGAGSPTERMRIDNAGRVMTGNLAGVTQSVFFNGTNGTSSQLLDTAARIGAINHAASTSGASVWLGHTRGTTLGTYTTLQVDDGMGSIAFFGADGANLDEGAQITALVDASPSNGQDMPGRLELATSLDGQANGPTTRLTVKNDGGVLIGPNTTSPGAGNIGMQSGKTIEWDGGTTNTFTCTAGHCSIEGVAEWDAGNDGTGSTLDADLLDGLDSLAFQPIDADLTSWAGVTRAAGFDTFAATPSSANLATLITDETGSGAAVFATSPGFTTAANPVSNDGASLGISGTAWSDLFLASGSVINFNNGDVTLTHSSNALTWNGGDLTAGGGFGIAMATGIIQWNSNEMSLTRQGTDNLGLCMGGMCSVSEGTATIATGAINAVSRSFQILDTEASAASDDLDTQAAPGGAASTNFGLQWWTASNDARTVVIKNNTGNIVNAGGDCPLDDDEDVAAMGYNGVLAKWIVISCNNGHQWTSDNDGAGSGLDADTLDGTSSAGFATPTDVTNKPESISFAASDETTAIAAGTGKIKFRMPYAFTVTGVRCSLGTAQSAGGGTLFTVDINEGDADADGGNPVSILSTKVTIDDAETTSAQAATAPVISDSALASDAEMSLDVDAIGTSADGAGLKCSIIGHQ